MSAIAALLQKKKTTIQESAPLPEITNEQALGLAADLTTSITTA